MNDSFIAGLLVGTPLLGRFFGLRDTAIVMVGAISHCVARVCYATVTKPFGFYTGLLVVIFHFSAKVKDFVLKLLTFFNSLYDNHRFSDSQMLIMNDEHRVNVLLFKPVLFLNHCLVIVDLCLVTATIHGSV